MLPVRMAVLGAGLALLCVIALTPHRLLRAEGASPIASAPIARVVPKTVIEHGRVRTDNYDWLRNTEDPEGIAYVQAENAYAERSLHPIKPLIDEIAAELREREAHEDASVP